MAYRLDRLGSGSFGNNLFVFGFYKHKILIGYIVGERLIECNRFIIRRVLLAKSSRRQEVLEELCSLLRCNLERDNTRGPEVITFSGGGAFNPKSILRKNSGRQGSFGAKESRASSVIRRRKSRALEDCKPIIAGAEGAVMTMNLVWYPGFLMILWLVGSCVILPLYLLVGLAPNWFAFLLAMVAIIVLTFTAIVIPAARKILASLISDVFPRILSSAPPIGPREETLGDPDPSAQ